MTARSRSVQMVAACVALLGLLLGATSSQAQVIRAGKERAVLAMIAPFTDGGTVVPGCTVAGVQISQDRIRVHLRAETTAAEPAAPTADAAPTKTMAMATLVLTPQSSAVRSATKRAFAVRSAEKSVPTSLAPCAAAMSQAIAGNDDGTFFDDTVGPSGAVTAVQTDAHRPAPDPRDRVPLSAEDSAFSLWDAPAAKSAQAVWVVWLTALFFAVLTYLWRVVVGPNRLRWFALGLVAVGLFASATTTRRALDMWPLHANNHAYEDISAALGGEGSGPAVQRHLAGYGASWLVAQRAAVELVGADHDGLADTMAWFSALAVLLAFAAALVNGGSAPLAIVLAAAVAWLPVTVHVGHSESTLAVAQLLVAATLLFAGCARHWWGVVGALTSAWLLSRGHVVGPPLAIGAVFIAFGLSASGLIAEDKHALKSWLGKLGIKGKPAVVAWLALLLSGPLVGFALRMGASADEVTARLDAAGSALPIPGNPMYFSLWLMDWAPGAAAALAVVGAVAILIREDERPSWLARTNAAAVLFGGVICVAASLLVCACLTDGLRYQSVLAGPVVAVGALAWKATQINGFSARWAARLFVVVLATMTFFGASRGGGIADAALPENKEGVDAQTRAYHFLRRQVFNRRGTLWILDPGRTSDRGAVLHPVAGKLTPRGPTLARLDYTSMQSMCDAALPLPGPVVRFDDPACAIDADKDGRALACKALDIFEDSDAPVATGSVHTAPSELLPKGLRGEFLEYGDRRLEWRYHRARCPTKTAP